MYFSKSLKVYIDDLAAKKPAPGGGSAAALIGSLACALLSMVCNYTLGKDKYKNVQSQIKEILKQTELLRKRFLVLVDLDVEAYHKVSNSRKGLGALYRRNLINATRVPLEICRQSARAYKFCPVLAKKANRYLISDVYVAKNLLKSSFKCGELNVKINLPQIKNKQFIKQANKTIKNLKKLL